MSATDIIAVEQPDGNLKASQFSIRFARKQKIRRVITVFVNGQQIMNNSGTVLVVDAGEVFAKFVKMDTLEDKDFTQNRKRDKFIRHLRSLSTIHQKSKSTDNVIFAPGALPPPTENIMPNPRDKVHMRGFVWSLASKFNQFAEEEEDSSENDSDSTPRTPQSASEILNHATVLRNIENAEKESKNEEKKRKYRSLHLPRFNSSSNGWSKSMGSMPVKHQSSPDSRLSLSNSLLQHIEEEYPQVQHVLAPAEFLQSLCLDREINIVKFLIASTGEEVHAKIFKWRYDTKIIISDVDGTITKSDIKGHIYTRLGRVDYTHEGISALYSQIATNGYKFLYLTARPITHIDFVRAYIEGIYQMEVKMPPGPVITSPNSTFNALAREVVLKRPDLFKKAVLNIVKDCFAGHNPFLAGFGNKHSDCDSYVSVGIDPSRSFRINTKGQVKIAASEQQFGSYLHVKKQINQFFPHMSPLHDMISEIGESVQSGVDELKDDFKEKMEDIAGVLKRTKSD